jgi:hypothetical protein
MMKRRLLMALAAGLLGALAAVPAAAATCSGSGCNGLSATTTGCINDAYIVSEADIYDSFSSDYVGEIDLWWSPTCSAGWAHTYSDIDQPFLVRATITSTSPSNAYTQNNNYAWTARSPMVYATSVSYVTACGRIEDVGVSGIACTP